MEKTKVKEIVLSVLFLIWFFGSMFVLLLISDMGYDWKYAVIVFAQVMLVFGIIANRGIKEKNQFSIGLIFIIVGIVGIIMPILVLIGAIEEETAITYTASGIFILVGGELFISSAKRNKAELKVCTCKVKAKVIDMVFVGFGDKGRKFYDEVLQYEYLGSKFTYSVQATHNIGDEVIINIDQNNPEHAYYMPLIHKTLYVVLGIGSVLSGLFILWATNQ